MRLRRERGMLGNNRTISFNLSKFLKWWESKIIDALVMSGPFQARHVEKHVEYCWLAIKKL